jgi:hypothetical protein
MERAEEASALKGIERLSDVLSKGWRDFRWCSQKMERLIVLSKMERLKRLTQRLAQIFEHCY